MDFFYLFSSASAVITNYELFATVNLGLLAVITIIFGFANMRKQVDEDFDHSINGLKLQTKQRDIIVSGMEVKRNKLKKSINNVSWWFRKCIYVNIIILLLIISSQFYKNFIFDVIIISSITFSCLVIGISIHSLKHIIDLDAKKILEEYKEALGKIEMKAENIAYLFELIIRDKKIS
ncbi:MAG: hypothetical protein AABX35_02390 [Nanoarchaeota archaeon]